MCMYNDCSVYSYVEKNKCIQFNWIAKTRKIFREQSMLQKQGDNYDTKKIQYPVLWYSFQQQIIQFSI